MSRSRMYSHQEEQANSISHAFGILLGIVAGYFLLQKAFSTQNVITEVSVIVYLFGMLSSYVSSTYYHYLPAGDKKRLLQKYDHAAIYLHIAGTYTPLLLIAMQEGDTWGWGIFSFVWLFALIGVFVSFKKSGKHSNIETVCYVVMGCSIFAAFNPLVNALEAIDKMPVLWWIIVGGISYIAGSMFYSLTKVKYMHTVFHFFVLIGSICHIIAIYILI